MSREIKVTVLIFFLTTLAGSALHFLYTFCPNALTAVLAPVDESIWEHGNLGLVILVVWGFLYNSVLKGPEFGNILSYVAEMGFMFWLPCRRSTPPAP